MFPPGSVWYAGLILYKKGEEGKGGEEMVKGEGKEKEIGKGMGKGMGERKGNSQGSWPLGLPSLVDTLC